MKVSESVLSGGNISIDFTSNEISITVKVSGKVVADLCGEQWQMELGPYEIWRLDSSTHSDIVPDDFLMKNKLSVMYLLLRSIFVMIDASQGRQR